MKKIVLFFTFLVISSQGFAGTNPFSCLDANGNKIIKLETIEDYVVLGRMHSQPLSQIETIAVGITSAKVGELKVLVIGLFQKAILVDSNGLIRAELNCQPGR